MSHADEQVLVVPTPLFREVGYFQGFSREVDRYLNELLSPQHTSYIPRREAEEDPSFKQLIPYVVFQHVDANGRVHVFRYTRGKGQGEGRLHLKHSVGVGGHISTVDTGEHLRATYAEGMRRELDEEVAIDTPWTERCVGLINDDESAVGRVHLGIVHLVTVEKPAVQPREADILSAGFQPIDELLSDLTGFETWSQICLRALFGENEGRATIADTHRTSSHIVVPGTV